MEKKTAFIIVGIIISLLMAVFFCFHILWPALDPVTLDMVKLFCCGATFGIFIGLWLGLKVEKEVKKVHL